MSSAPGEVKPGQSIEGMVPELLGAIVTHPAQQAIFERIVELIGWLRACDEPSDYDQFQRHLFGDIHQTEERRSKCNQAIKRLRSRKTVPADVIDLMGLADPTDVAAWQLEQFMYERLARQLRCVGDALAWRCYRYDRPAIIALSRNDSPGPMYNKTGLPYELGRIEEIWKNDGHFALLHDLTNCLRIADLSEIVPGGMTWLREIKAKPHTDSRQMARAQAAIDATFSGGPIPGSDARFVQLDTPFRTSISSLLDCIELAKRRGVQGMKLPQGRALVTTSLVAAQRRWRDDMDSAPAHFESERRRAMKRAGIQGATHHLKGVSADTASRSPFMVPWALYSLDATDCASLICDRISFELIISVDELAARLTAHGLGVEVLLPSESRRMPAEGDVLRISWQNRSMIFHNSGVGQFIYELLEPETWARGVAELLRMDDPPSEPVAIYANEAKQWAS